MDDRPDGLLALQSILAELDQDLVTVRSGEEALRRLLAKDFAVILLDVQMPGMDGFETAVLIRQRERSRNTPIIFVTARMQDQRHLFEGYSVGAVDYVLKPFEPEVLRSKVRIFLELAAARRELEAEASRRQASERELQRHAGRLETVNKELESFAFSVSHDCGRRCGISGDSWTP